MNIALGIGKVKNIDYSLFLNISGSVSAYAHYLTFISQMVNEHFSTF